VAFSTCGKVIEFCPGQPRGLHGLVAEADLWPFGALCHDGVEGPVMGLQRDDGGV
jgi:hypothetical protein